MKKLLLFSAFCTIAFALAAQSSKKYLLIEHFTNSWCSICKSKNPTFYNTIAPYSADIHHIAIHPSTPYVQCTFYQANKTENQARADYYGVVGTPQVALNGKLAAVTTPLLPLATLQTALAQTTAPLSVKVTDAVANGNISGTVQIKFDQALPAGEYRIFVAVVEKLITLTTQNGEKEHHDVFRDMLTAIDGDPISPGGAGQTLQFSYTTPLKPAWKASELYLMAYILNKGTKEVLNSGTRFDISTAVQEPATVSALHIAPNPVTDVAQLTTGGEEAIRQVEVSAMDGRVWPVAMQQQNGQVHIQTGHLPKGIYLIKAYTDNRIYLGKMLVMAQK